MKEQLILLAKEKGFVSSFLHNEPYKYSSKEELRWLFWMEELKKQLREWHNIHISLYRNGSGWGWQLEKAHNGTTIKDIEDYNFFNIYEEAFEIGLFEALKLIDNE